MYSNVYTFPSNLAYLILSMRHYISAIFVLFACMTLDPWLQPCFVIFSWTVLTSEATVCTGLL